MFQVRFGTVRPVMFREIEAKLNIDVDISARFHGYAEVTEFDKSLYADEAQVNAAIKENCSEMISRSLNENWDSELSVTKNWNQCLGGMLDLELASIGITAKTTVLSMAMLVEDEDLLKDLKKQATCQSPYVSWDHVNFDAFEKAIKNNTRHAINFRCYGFQSDRYFYEPGEKVVVTYFMVSPNVSYTFGGNVDDLTWEYGSPIKLTFTMPDHDVELTLKEQIPLADPCGQANAASGYATPVTASTPSVGSAAEWICPTCQTKNTGKFCYECGNPKPI